MKSIAALAFFALATMSVACMAPPPDEPLDDERASEEAVPSATQDFPPIIPTCDGTRYEVRTQQCPINGQPITCHRRCDYEGHWAPFLQRCVDDEVSCWAWICPPCPP